MVGARVAERRGWGGEKVCAEMPLTWVLGSGSLSGTFCPVLGIHMYILTYDILSRTQTRRRLHLPVCMFWYSFGVRKHGLQTGVWRP